MARFWLRNSTRSTKNHGGFIRTIDIQSDLLAVLSRGKILLWPLAAA